MKKCCVIRDCRKLNLENCHAEAGVKKTVTCLNKGSGRMQNKKGLQIPNTIENAPVSVWLKMLRKNPEGFCWNEHILFWAQEIGLELNEKEKAFWEKHYDKSDMKRLEDYYGADFKNELQRKRLQEIELGELPRQGGREKDSCVYE